MRCYRDASFGTFLSDLTLLGEVTFHTIEVHALSGSKMVVDQFLKVGCVDGGEGLVGVYNGWSNRCFVLFLFRYDSLLFTAPHKICRCHEILDSLLQPECPSPEAYGTVRNINLILSLGKDDLV